MSITCEVKEDFGSFGDGKWQKHLTLTSWNGREPVYDLRPWSEDMSQCGKGITMSKEDLYDLFSVLEDLLGLGDEEDEEGEPLEVED